jgi:hypothetical protein
VYHINAVDTVTQWQVIGCAARSAYSSYPSAGSDAHQFPFAFRFSMPQRLGFINHGRKLLEKLWWSSPSRANRSRDNWNEGKNGR